MRLGLLEDHKLVTAFVHEIHIFVADFQVEHETWYVTDLNLSSFQFSHDLVLNCVGRRFNILIGFVQCLGENEEAFPQRNVEVPLFVDVIEDALRLVSTSFDQLHDLFIFLTFLLKVK